MSWHPFMRQQGEPAGSEAFHLISDAPELLVSQDNDYLKFLPFADALAYLIDQKATSPAPLIVAISAPWGAGKTTLASLVAGQLGNTVAWDQEHIICWFSAWQHDDAPHLGAAFAAAVARGVNDHRRWWRQIIQPLPSPMLTPELRWRRRCIVILVSFIIAVGLVLETKSRNLLLAITQPTSVHWQAAERDVHGPGLSLLIGLSILAFIYPKIFSSTKAVARFIEEPGTEAAQGSMADVRRQLGNLVGQATHGDRRLIIFVDDLERCRPPRAVEVCEVASQLLNRPDIVTVLVADMHVIAMSAAIKYRGLELPAVDKSDSARAAYEQYGREYLEKIIQVQFDLPPAGLEQLRELLAGERPAQEKKPSPWSRLRSWLDPSSAAAVAVITGALAALLPEDIIVIVPIMVATGLALLSGTFLERLRKGRAQQVRRNVDASLRQTFKLEPEDQPVGAPGDEPEGAPGDQPEGAPAQPVSIAATMKATAEEQGQDESYVQKRTIHLFLEQLAKDKVMVESDELVYRYLPDRPRAAKRLLNQVRLLIVITLHRDLFGARDAAVQKINAKRIAKWVILQERWPDVVRAGAADPDVLPQLESWARARSLNDLRIGLKANGVGDVGNLADLQELLACVPALGDLQQLITLGGATFQPLMTE